MTQRSYAYYRIARTRTQTKQKRYSNVLAFVGTGATATSRVRRVTQTGTNAPTRACAHTVCIV